MGIFSFKSSRVVAIVAAASACAAIVGQAQAALIQIAANPTVLGLTGWNTIVSNTGDFADPNFLVDSTGAPTSIELITDNSNAFHAGTNDFGTTTPSGDAAIFPSQTTASSFFGNTPVFQGSANPLAIWTFDGFNPGESLEFTFFASRMGVADTRETLYEVIGASTSSATLETANNQTEVATVTVQADASGSVELRMSAGANTNSPNEFYYLGAMRVETVPEPTAMLLVLLGSLGLAGLRRR